MTPSRSRRSIPTSVDFAQGHCSKGALPKKSQQLDTQPSKPIPIKHRRRDLQELEDEAFTATSSSHYDWATWRMYNLITDARRLRALSRSNCSSQQSNSGTFVAEDFLTLAQERVRHDLPDPAGGLSSQDEPFDDGVFVFDAM
ncbi:hypothetical protein ACHAWF_005317 [Thalassiosira exigua]